MADQEDRRETPSQTAGPYVHIGLAPRAAGFEGFAREVGETIAGPEAAGEHIRVEGRVLDGAGAPVTDVLIEVWQADMQGSYAPSGQGASAFTGFGRVSTDLTTGAFSFETIKPGRVPGPGNQTQAPHLNLWLLARGINTGLNTRMYFSDEAEANASDPILALIPDPARRKTLIARRADSAGDGDRGPAYRFEIHLQGPSETVFLDV
jgi:protocatechuate 3,4-dioxygenase alpha subunit